MVGNNDLVFLLRTLTAIELFINCEYYVDHPIFLKVNAENQKYSISSLLNYSISHSSLDTGQIKSDLVKSEAKGLFLLPKKWSGFLSILALSSVLKHTIFTYYPDSGADTFVTLFNQEIHPRGLINSSSLHILFCSLDSHISIPFKPTHFCPIIFHTENSSRYCKRTSDVMPSLAPIQKKICFKPAHPYTKPRSTETIRASFKPLVPKVSKQLTKTTLFEYFSKDKCQNVDVSSNNTQSFPLFEEASTSISPFPSPETGNSANLTVNTVSKSINSVENVNDIAFLREKVSTLSDSALFNVIQNLFKPTKTFQFPLTNNRRFQLSWLDKFLWLRYSQSNDGAYCISCVLFGDRFPHKIGRMRKLFSEPFQKWGEGNKQFLSHSSTKNGLHEFTFPVFYNFSSQMSGKTQPINISVNSIISQKVKQNRVILRNILDCVIHCARTNSSFRGHRDDFKYLPKPGEHSSGGIGCFNETLNFAVRNGNTVLEDHLNNCSKNATYISKTSQNELIKCCGQEITETILKKVRANKFFSILADEACDVSTKEQMAIILRYVDTECNIREEFVRFVHCSEGLRGKDLSVVMLKCLEDLDLDIMNCRGQGYDGAGSVSGHINGLSAHILKVNPKALYTHCHSHRLNLTVCDACNIPMVSDVFDKVREVSDFFSSSQIRLEFLQSSITENNPDSAKKKLKDVCRTRWIERIEGLSIFLDNFLCIDKAFCEMGSSTSCNRDTKCKALTFSRCIANFSFMFTLIVVTRVLEITLPVTRLLQGRSIDIVDGIHLISSLKAVLLSMRTDIEKSHNEWFSEAVLLAKKCDISVSKNRTCNRQTLRTNIPCETVSDYFKKAVSIPFLDYICTSMIQRFDEKILAVYKGLSIIPYNLKKSPKSLSWKEDFKTFSDFYADDLPSPLLLDGELKNWEKYWETFEGSIPENISATLKAINYPGFENIQIALRILGTLPVTSCECERSFSAMRRLKDYTRSTMTSDRFNGLAMMYIHQEIVPDVEKVIDLFSVSNRKLEFT